MRYFLRRILFLIGTLWVAVTINFFLPRMMPGNPVEAMMARLHEKGNLTPATVNAIRAMLGIKNVPLPQQYWIYLGEVIHFNFGVSYTYFPYSVRYMVGQALPWTLVLVGVATVISFGVGTGLGIVAASHRGKTQDSIFTTIASFTNTFPYFWFGLVALYFLAFVFKWFPLAGAYTQMAVPNLSLSFLLDAAYHGILPGLTIVVASIGGWLLGMRNNMINTLGEDYVLLAQAKGLSEGWVSYMYVARNALLPNITGFAIALGFVVGGSLLTEIVFSYPGVGYLLYNAVINEDYPLMQALFLVIVVCVVLANFVADLVYVLFDPRVRREGAS